MYSPVDDPKKCACSARQPHSVKNWKQNLKSLPNARKNSDQRPDYRWCAGTHLHTGTPVSRGKKQKTKAKEADATKETEQAETESPLNNILTQVGTVLATQATVFLLSLAKEKLTAYLRDSANAKTDEHS